MSDPRHKKILQKKRLFLTDNLVLKGTRVLDQLFQDGVLNHAQFTKMNLETRENEERVSDLLSLLYARPYEDWEKFLKALFEHNQEHVAKELSVFEATADPEMKRLQSLLAEKILEHHNTSEVWQKDSEFREVSIDDIFVDLEITKGNIDGGSNAEEEKLQGYRDIYDEISTNKTVVVFGQPGSGKSTLSKRLCCDWAKLHEKNATDTDDSTLHNFSFILHISLLAVEKTQTFQEYLCETYQIKENEAESMYNIIEKNQETVVIVLDEKENYDEGTSEEITRVLNGQLFPKVKMLITSRSLSLPVFCNDSHLPIKTLSLQGLSDEGVKMYARKLYTTRAGTLLPHLDYMEHRWHTRQYPAFLPMILRIILKEIQNKKLNDTEYCLEYVAYTIRRAQRKWKGLVTPEESNNQILEEHRALIRLFGQLAKENVKPEKMETKFSEQQVRKYQKQLGGLMFEFLNEHKENGETVYMFPHKTLQELFLSYYLINCDKSDLEDILLEFCNCRAAFAGSRVKDILEGFNWTGLATNIGTISSGSKTEMAALNTELQLHYFYRHEGVNVTLPKVMAMSIYQVRTDFDWNRYLAMDGSHLEELTFVVQERFLGSLNHLNAPHLTSITLQLAGSHPSQESENQKHIEETLSKFPLKTLEIQKSWLYGQEYVKSAAVTAACKLVGLEKLVFSQVCLESGHTQQLTQRLQESVLKTLVIYNCELDKKRFLGLIDAVSTSTSLESLDISGNWYYEDAGQLVDVTDKFRKLRKLNLSENSLSEERKQKIKDKLKMYPHLEVKM